ncbi:hypothetical protein [uncultured Aquimarina sp.]|uniref:hypothetical protein n=1 Tax=uncultured Aquimarina sp. TaxID=575652 RepID=UPI00261FAD92|nr:hypothetical protein [uncultured Aquimarina sp.]
MLNHKDKTILNVIRQLEGMQKIDAYDTLHKIEELLLHQKSPIEYNEVEKFQKNLSIKNNVIHIENNGYYYLEDSCFLMSVYKHKSILPSLLTYEKYFFKLETQNSLHSFNNKNVKQIFRNSKVYNDIIQFLRANNVKKRNVKTKRLLFIEFLEMLDMSKSIS